MSIRNLLLLIIFFFSASCTTIYYGGFEKSYFDELSQPNKLGNSVEQWEDGSRINDDNGLFEWWYFDAELDDGSVLVTYFYKVHFLKDQFFIGLNYTSPNGENTFEMTYFDKSDVSFSSDSCDVKMGLNVFKGDLKNYKILLNPKDFGGFGMEVNLNSNSEPYRPQDGILKAGEDYFAWLAAVPAGNVTGTISQNGKTRSISGKGYHDHNWGNTPLQQLFNSWTWFRGIAGPYTVIVAELNVVDSRGGFDVPILYVSDENGVIVDKFGNKELQTMKSNLIKNFYPKKNEPQFSEFTISSLNDISVRIKGGQVIDNIELFKRMKMPFPLRWGFQLTDIDPFYTRFSSELIIDINGQQTHQGTGVLEIMDLH